uniref:NADH-ubiquinone oxidoreductase chain 4 n=1 Tax=Diadegma semiclausum TaxID=208481 RepID=C4N026_DIASM|nr:NADH dehydrogenase subunit 4 [Diadegma semiclausum]ACF35064.1 NADH dehydrogenase subunit 4 [Diadegma semiclausum]
MMKLIIMLMFMCFQMNKFYMQFFMYFFFNLFFFFFIIKFPLNLNNYFMNLYYIFGMDLYSWGLMLLSIWIINLMLMASNKFLMNNNFKYYKNLIYWMLFFLLMCFFSMNMFMFYFFFESSLIPVFLLILGWGNQIERIQAGFYMMLYTLFGSMPLFLMIIYLYKSFMILDFNMIFINKMSIYIYLSMIMGFLIKLPMYFFHLWLPKAHVEAPIIGSMILAGVMLKLGSYGLMRVLLLMKNLCFMFNKFFMVISLLGGLISSFICLVQIDLKMLIAYSSVVHMSILLSGMMTLFSMGYMGGFLMMISHGLCSSGLFFLLNINYERLNSRSLYLNKGLINLMPSLTLMWFLLSSSNLSFPFSLNLFSEIFLLNSLLIWDKYLLMILILITFFSACYSLYMYSYSQHGKMNNLNLFYESVKINNYMIILMHWIPLNMMFILMYMFM